LLASVYTQQGIRLTYAGKYCEQPHQWYHYLKGTRDKQAHYESRSEQYYLFQEEEKGNNVHIQLRSCSIYNMIGKMKK